MLSYLASFSAATILAATITPLVSAFARKVGALSEGGGRHVHSTSIPRLGGIGIAVATLLPLALLFSVDSSVANVVRSNAVLALGLLGGGAVMCAVGAYDDVRGMRALYKLLAQAAAASAAYAAGFRIEAISLPGLGVLEMGAFSFLLTLIWIIGVTNAVNLIDGLDGLAAGVVFFAAGTNFVVGLMNGSVFVCVVMAALMGALFGFLFYNFNPARIFMGDSGSYFLGYTLATISLVGSLQKASTAVSLLVPVLALGVPIFDTLFTMLRRGLEQRPLFSPDRGHVHHKLLDLGLTHRRAVLVLYGISISFAGTAVAVALGKNWEIGGALIVAVVLVVGLVRFSGGIARVARRARIRANQFDETSQKLRLAVPATLQQMLALNSKDQIPECLKTLQENAGLNHLALYESAPESVERSRTEVVQDYRLVGGKCLIARWETEGGIPSECYLLLLLVADSIEATLARIEGTSPEAS